MPTDDILWRKVDSLKSQETEKPKTSLPASQQSPENVVASHTARPQQVRSRASRQDNSFANNRQRERASTQASTLTCYPPEWVETIRKVVKTTGKEVAFTRLTAQEKGRLTDVVYGFRRHGMKTTENEVLRIALNHVLQDFEACGKQSFLQKVLEALLA